MVYFVLFTFAFLPQYAFLAIFHGWGAWVNAVVLVLGEGLVISQGVFEGFFVDECRVDVFDVSLVHWPWNRSLHERRLKLMRDTSRLYLSNHLGSSLSHPTVFYFPRPQVL